MKCFTIQPFSPNQADKKCTVVLYLIKVDHNMHILMVRHIKEQSIQANKTAISFSRYRVKYRHTISLNKFLTYSIKKYSPCLLSFGRWLLAAAAVVLLADRGGGLLAWGG